jgi:hypothetical protein
MTYIALRESLETREDLQARDLMWAKLHLAVRKSCVSQMVKRDSERLSVPAVFESILHPF